MEYRWQQVRSLQPDRQQMLTRAIDGRCGAEIARLAHEVVTNASACRSVAEPLLCQTRELVTRLQPCLRDVWHDHVLFDEDKVSGLIDFGAMRVDTPAGDIARLLGSLVRDDADGWQAGLAAYETVRPLATTERMLLAAFDVANVTLAGIHWIGWLYIEGRQFEELDRVASRLLEIRQRVAALAAGESAYDGGGIFRGNIDPRPALFLESEAP
jgi:homoserine kinase type II